MPCVIDIERWIADQGPPSSYPHPHELPPTPPRAPPSRKRKRTALAETSSNMPSPSTPRRPTVKGAEAEAPPPGQATWPNDPDTTPRQPPAPPQLPLRDTSCTDDADNDVSAVSNVPASASVSASGSETISSHAGSETSRASKKRKRTNNPQKQLAMWQYAEYHIGRGSLANVTKSNVPKDLWCLSRDVKNIQAGIDIIDIAQASEGMRRAVGDGDEESDQALWAQYFDRSGRRRGTGTAPPLESIQQILRDAERDLQLAASEAAWNCDVHKPLLALARQYSVHSRRQSWDNVTTACIHPQDLIPNKNEQEKVPSKKIDFALTLELDEATRTRLIRRNVQLNQSDYMPLVCNILAVSVETKLADGNISDAKLQLSTWVAAQISRLRQLVGDVDIPPLPLILVQGHVWTILCFHDHGSGRKSATFYDAGIEIGSTISYRDAYKVVCGLQYLMAWAEGTFRPWFEKYVLEQFRDQ